VILKFKHSVNILAGFKNKTRAFACR